MDRASKLRKLDAFRRRLPYISASALAEVLRAVEAEGIPELHNRQHVLQGCEAVVGQMTPYGPHLISASTALVSGGAGRVDFINPLAMLWKAYQQGGGWAELFRTKLQHHPPSPEAPWRLIMYSDEVAPGNNFGCKPQESMGDIFLILRVRRPFVAKRRCVVADHSETDA